MVMGPKSLAPGFVLPHITWLLSHHPFLGSSGEMSASAAVFIWSGGQLVVTVVFLHVKRVLISHKE